jgi:hypothetical protein
MSWVNDDAVKGYVLDVCPANGIGRAPSLAGACPYEMVSAC